MLRSALHRLGVDDATLSPAERDAFARDGYAIIPGMLTPVQTRAMAARLVELAAEEGEAAGKDFHTEPGTTRLGSLINKDALFDVCFLHPKVLAAAAIVIGESFGLSSITSRSAKPGEGQQGFHRDSAHPAVNALWLISDFTPDNGPTRLVPGSHRLATDPREALADVNAPHPDQVYLVAPAGSLVIINGQLWHSGTRNNSNALRHLISAFWLPRGHYQPEANRRLAPAAYQRLSEDAREVIDHEYPVDSQLA